MKILILILLSFQAVNLARAEDRERKPLQAEEIQRGAQKKPCPLCKVPGRAALFAGGFKARPCDAACAKLCCKGTELVLLLDAVATEGGARKVTAALSGLKGVEVAGVLGESGRTLMKYSPARTSPSEVRGALERAGLKITAELCAFRITGLEKPGASDILVEALASTAGVRAIDAVCPATGQAIIEYDPARTTRQRLVAAINATPCKVIP